MNFEEWSWNNKNYLYNFDAWAQGKHLVIKYMKRHPTIRQLRLYVSLYANLLLNLQQTNKQTHKQIYQRRRRRKKNVFMFALCINPMKLETAHTHMLCPLWVVSLLVVFTHRQLHKHLVILSVNSFPWFSETKFSLLTFTLNWNCLKASTKGIPSMSPMVPPSSMMHTSGSAWSPSTGRCATVSTHSWIASVMCGTTWKEAMSVYTMKRPYKWRSYRKVVLSCCIIYFPVFMSVSNHVSTWSWLNRLDLMPMIKKTLFNLRPYIWI